MGGGLEESLQLIEIHAVEFPTQLYVVTVQRWTKVV